MKDCKKTNMEGEFSMNEKNEWMKLLGFEEEVLRSNNKVFCCEDVPVGMIGNLQASVNPDSGVHYLWHTPDETLADQTCTVPMTNDLQSAKAALDNHPLAGWWENEQPRFIEMVDGKLTELETERYASQSLFSRNGTLVAGEALQRKMVIIVGCGSVGSQIAVHLTRAGVTRFCLIDSDCVELHNLSRTFDRSMLGQFKTKAVARSLRLINPLVQVSTYECRVENVDASFYEALVPGETLIIGCADNRASDEYLCSLAADLKLDFLSAGFWSNATVTENFVYRSDTEDHTYGCLLREAIIEDARAQHTQNYVNAESTAKPNAGLGCSVQMGNSISAQLALDLLLRHEETYHSQLLPALGSQMLLFVCTNNPALAGDEVRQWAPRPLWSQCCSLKPQDGCTCHSNPVAAV